MHSTLNIHELARQWYKLQRFVDTSTAYIAPHTSKPLYETLCPLSQLAWKIIEDIESGRVSEDEVLRLTGHPNTYSLTKCLAEHLLLDREKDIPVTIVRPSIISASKCFPFPGWIDSHAALAAFVTAAGAGVLHVIDGNPEVLLDVVPVDVVANVLIDEAFFNRGTYNSRIVYAVATLNHSIQVGAASAAIQSYFKNPGRRRCKVNYLGPRNLTFDVYDLSKHKVPFLLGKIFFSCTSNKKMLTQTKQAAHIVAAINRVFPTFTNHTYDFRPSVPVRGEFDAKGYLEVVCDGVERNLLSGK